jgi:transcriptional regulator with XRE-family HTH domain
MPPGPWTDEELRALRAAYKSAKGGAAPLKAIAEALGRSPGSVVAKANELGLGERPDGYRFGRPNSLGGTLGALAAKLGGNGKLAAKLGVDRRTPRKWQAGETEPSLETRLAVAALAADHGVELDEIFRIDPKTARNLAKLTK